MTGIYMLVIEERVLYVGCSVDISRRRRDHLSALRRGSHHNFIVQRFWNKHNTAITFHTLQECGEEELSTLEDHYICSLEPIANISDARGSHRHTQEAKAKMQGRVVTDATREKLSIAHKGKPNGRKGIPTGVVPSTAFGTGNVPWNKGRNGYSTKLKGGNLTTAHKDALRAAKELAATSHIGEVYGTFTIVAITSNVERGRDFTCECVCGAIEDIKIRSLKLLKKCKGCNSE